MGRLIRKTVEDIKLQGFSLAGEESVIVAPEYNVAFDVGRAPREIISIDNVCLSHGHMDHSAGIAYYFSQRSFIGAPPGRLIVPQILVDPIRRLMDVWSEIESHHSPGEIVGVRPLQDVEIRRNLIVRPFAVNHPGQALGYTLIELRHKLKEEFVGKTGPQLVVLKREGIAIEDHIEVPMVTYSGDTAVGRFLDHDFVRQSKVFLVECTFFEPDHRTRAQAGRHMHVDDMPRVYEAVPEGRIVIVHLTRRTDLKYAKRMLERLVGKEDYERTTFLMERPPRFGPRTHVPNERGPAA